MQATDSEFAMLVEQALENLRTQPKDLAKGIAFVASINDITIWQPLGRLVRYLKICGPNDRVRHALIRRLQQWDHEESPSWSTKTAPHSELRRQSVLRLLGFDSGSFAAIDAAIPRFTESEVPIIIAQAHQQWYEARKRSIRSFYWKHYQQQLSKPEGSWEPEAVAVLDVSTDDVINRLSDPTRTDVYQVKGLVMGYVQSGKTSHFSGLIAKAADAGYRLIIVLAGTLDILRQQTQRRIDKEIVGRELLGTEEYGTDADWSAFVQHHGIPREIGYFDFERLTNRQEDYAALVQHLAALQFTRVDPSRPFNDPVNLAGAPVRLAVIKKTPKRITNLTDDLERLRALRTVLEHVPTLVIDDESDQASINTTDQTKPGKKGKRTSTNFAISRLLELLSRAQYVGYTATPFANVFINAEDAADLFPKDFIVSLPRPDGYMGVSDFYDFDSEPDGFRSNRRAFVRPVEGLNSDDKNLPEAIDSFVLAGAIKLYRQHCDPEAYRFRHHTMLIHHSAKKVVHEEEAKEVRDIFKGGSRYRTLERLRKLFKQDFTHVSAVRAPGEPFPKRFGELTPFISDCITRICDEKPVLIVNGDNQDDTPDFDQRPVWAILVGGAKLSRGYTVEGLTTSYYRRPTGAGDTLMQMGRWFGFRPGYRDLVRLYIGKRERKGKLVIDLYEAFGAVCRDEEALRRELQKYAKGDLTPRQVPPLVLQHAPYVPPTSKNKMFNAKIESMDLAGAWTEKTSAPMGTSDMVVNLEGSGLLLSQCRSVGRYLCTLTNKDGARRAFDAFAGLVGTESVMNFLEEYRWQESRGGIKPIELELKYIRKQNESGRLTEWLVLLPQAKTDHSIKLQGSGAGPLSVIRRDRVSETRFGVYSEPRHRDVAQYLVGAPGGKAPSAFLRKHRSAERPVLVLYLVEPSQETASSVSVGFGIQFPGTKVSNAIVWSVEDKKREDDVVVSSHRTPAVRRR